MLFCVFTHTIKRRPFRGKFALTNSVTVGIHSAQRLFAGSEIAFLSLNGVKLAKQAEGGDKTAARLLALVENPNRFLSAIQVAITLSGFLGAAFGTENFSGYLSDFLTGLGLPLPAGW